MDNVHALLAAVREDIALEAHMSADDPMFAAGLRHAGGIVRRAQERLESMYPATREPGADDG